MGSLILSILFLVLGVFALLFSQQIMTETTKALRKIVVIGSFIISALFGVSGSISYNDAGYCTYVQTIFGNESSTCDTGWYFSGWGRTTAWPHFITVAHSKDEMSGSSVSVPYSVRLADNWSGEITQTTRFGIPQDPVQFLKLHKDFRSPERFVATTLKPAITSSLDSVANLFSMEEYYAGGKRDQFKTEFKDAVVKGRAKVKQVYIDTTDKATVSKVAASDDDITKDTSDVGHTNTKRLVMEKVVDAAGNTVREPHGYMAYGITVSSAILENLDPDDRFEQQIQSRKDAASRRIVAQEQRREQEEQRLLAIQTGETDIAKRQAAAKVEQIQKTTDAETNKKLALIEAQRQKEEAEIAKQTAAIDFERAKIDAQSKKVSADAEAYAKKAIIVADGALDKKLSAYVEVSKVWANAFAKRQVPTTTFTGGGESSNGNFDAQSFMQILTVKAAKDLAFEPQVKATE